MTVKGEVIFIHLPTIIHMRIFALTQLLDIAIVLLRHIGKRMVDLLSEELTVC